MCPSYSLCIIGAGTYGSYLLRRLVEEYGEEVSITLVEIGDETIRTEEETGLASESPNYKSPKLGRYFGLGGTSDRWGGHLIFFDERDNPGHDPAWEHIIAVNEKHKERVLDKLLGSRRPRLFDSGGGGIFKTGVWLKYGRRNLFRHLTRQQLQDVRVLKNLRVTGFAYDGERITGVRCKDRQGQVQTVTADVFYLTAGAIESCRLLLEFSKQNQALAGTDLGKNAGDHVSTELFRIQGKPVVKGTNLSFAFRKGNLVTKRIVVHSSDGKTGYLLPIYNKEVKVFSSIKQLLFGRQKSAFLLRDILQGIPFLVMTFLHFIFKKKLYTGKVWSLQLDLEQATPNHHSISLHPALKDAFGESGVAIQWCVTEDDLHSMLDISQQTAAMLAASGLSFVPMFEQDTAHEKIEDIYHPVGFIRMGNDGKASAGLDCKVKGTSNLYHFSTALFPSAKSINPTAAGFCLIEEHVEGL
ncbi:MAG: GMC family oxidoreductase [Saprospiraceae bacterium]|nr:MAG: GMC family oxidoreductase [Saprospiraceae bacterium]